jgi:hypothetical protein
MIAPVGPSGVSVRVVAGYLAGIALGTTSVTLLFLGMRAVMDVGGACADGGPYVSAQPCPDGVPIAMVGGMFGLFGAAGLVVWFGSRIGTGAASIVALGWPALFLALGYNFVQYAFNPPDTEPTPVWGWLIPGAIFWLMGGAPLVVGLAAWRAARSGRPGNRLSQQVERTVRSRPIIFGPAVATPSVLHPRAPGPESASAPDPAAADPAGDPAAVASDDQSSDLVDDLSRLADLHDAGDLTDAEFAAAKESLLDESGREARR